MDPASLDMLWYELTKGAHGNAWNSPNEPMILAMFVRDNYAVIKDIQQHQVDNIYILGNVVRPLADSTTLL